ncbi:hypothetical protein P4H39_07520 [Paenibacillus lautus]|uniref:hypothetical protein n=1 Tax=Paenibacillus lautus TaxID=1401 RepID=UPI002DBE4430|nr:hypothetical protein [Paenibacillus lautus]MEC0202468.1 hypothetical protein [Paenibacillus lautus]
MDPRGPAERANRFRKSVAVAFGAEFLLLLSSFRKFGNNSDWRNDTTVERLHISPFPQPKGGGFF